MCVYLSHYFIISPCWARFVAWDTRDSENPSNLTLFILFYYSSLYILSHTVFRAPFPPSSCMHHTFLRISNIDLRCNLFAADRIFLEYTSANSRREMFVYMGDVCVLLISWCESLILDLALLLVAIC